MDNHKIVLVIAILIVRIICKEISVNHDESTRHELEVPIECQKHRKSSMELEPCNEEKSTENIKTIFPKYFQKYSNNSFCQFLFLKKDDTEEIEAFKKSRNQSKGLRDIINKNEKYGTCNIKSKVTEILGIKQQDNTFKSNFNLGLKNKKGNLEITNPNKNIHKNFRLDKIPTSNPFYIIDKFYQFFSEIGMNTNLLSKPVNPEIMKSIHFIYEEFSQLIEKDVENNAFPLAFFQTVLPVTKERVLPHLLKTHVKKFIAEIDKTYETPQLFKMLMNLAEISEDVTKNITTVSDTVKSFIKYVEDSLPDNNERNKKLATLYKKNMKSLLKIIDKDLNENKRPLNLIRFIINRYTAEKNSIEKLILKQLIKQKLRKQADDFQTVRYHRSLKSTENEEVLKNPDSDQDSDEDSYQDSDNVLPIGSFHDFTDVLIKASSIVINLYEELIYLELF